MGKKLGQKRGGCLRIEKAWGTKMKTVQGKGMRT